MKTKTLRGLKISISNVDQFSREEIDQLRYALFKILVKFGDKKIKKSFSRAKGMTVRRLQGRFGNTIYLASRKERLEAIKMLRSLQPRSMVGYIRLEKTCRDVVRDVFDLRVHTFRHHVA